MALTREGTVVCWGENSNGECSVPAGLSNVVAIAAGGDPSYASRYSLALTSDGQVVAWGSGEVLNPVAGLSNVIAVGGGAHHALAVRTGPRTPVIVYQPWNQYQVAGGAVTFYSRAQGVYGVNYQWQFNGMDVSGATNATLTLTNVQSSHEGTYRVVVSNEVGTLASSSANFYLVTPPVFTSQSQPTNVICIEGNYLSFTAVASAPHQANGFPLSYQWRWNGTSISGATTTNYQFTANETNGGTYTLVASNAVGTASVFWSVTVTNAINVTNDLLLIYNTNSADSIFVKDYYLAHRPNVSGANVLGIGCPGIYIGTNGGGSWYYGITNLTVFESITASDFTNQVLVPVQIWLTNNPAKHPQYVIMMLDVPSRIDELANAATNYPFYSDGGDRSVSYLMANALPTWKPFITHINMNGTNDCVAYINKLATLGVSVSSNNPVLSASVGGYGNANYIFDNVNNLGYAESIVSNAITGLVAAGVQTNSIFYLYGLENGFGLPHLTNAVNLAGYISWGVHSSLGANYAVDGSVKWVGSSSWWIIRTEESYNGHRYQSDFGTFSKWFSSGSFGGTNYSHTPVGAVSYTDEPGASGADNMIYFGQWAAGKNFGICAWNSTTGTFRIQVVGDPLIAK
jgi:hypothetical protein